ncbi:MarR family winged helix-turn-helix transcriptional regulator [Mycolicibacterium sediminis]|uniref:MarR family transcriptional regulator n=1 Tax=Mycolicibacterium sediminis TaxID=1286180 RepID=A0A7I7QXV7_9MYCO|nr:MarR family transcriptional regulator [Mycolicibacterium sediminis]BBY31115.1 MarR family transcriptional regulator [Mycolicibacterium sediminis]
MTEPNTAALMFIAHRAAESRVHTALRASGFDDLTVAQTKLAQRLDPNGIRVTDLADRAHVTKQTAGALVDDLERNGYVERTPDPADARARLVILSDRGRDLCAAAAAEVSAVEREWREHLGAAGYDRLRQLLLELRDVTDPFR